MLKQYHKPFLTVLGTSIFVKFVGLLKELLLGWTFGATRNLDNFLLIISIPNIINATWNKALETVLLTTYQKQKMENGETAANQFLTNLVIALTFITGGIYLLLFFLLDTGLGLLYGVSYSKEIAIAAKIVTVVILIETIILAVKVFNFAQKKYFLPTILPLFQSGSLVICLLLLWNHLNLLSLSWIYLLGTIIQITLLIQYRWFWVQLIRVRATVFYYLRKVLKNASLLAIASGISTLNIFVDKSFALKISEGAITMVHYGAFFLTMYQILFVRNINIIFFPQFQEYVLLKKFDELRSDSEKIMKVIFLLSLITWIFIINNGYFFLDLVLGHGRIAPDDIRVIYYCLLGYGLSFLGMAINAIIIRILQVYDELRVILYVSFVNFGLNIVFNYLFVRYFGIWGIPLSTSVTFIIIGIIYLIFLKKKRNLIIVQFRDWWYRRYFAVFSVLCFFEILYLMNRPVYHLDSIFINVLVAVSNLIITLVVLWIFKIIFIENFRIKLNF